MVPLTALRQHPRFGRFFAVVHPFFWPVIWWTLNAVFRQYDASNRTEFLLGITWWGQVYIAFEGDLRPDPLTYRPIPRTFRPLTDAGWGSDLPANLEGLSRLEALRDVIFPREAGGGGSLQRCESEGALTSPKFDSS
jgi:hypothetical protein